MATGRWDGDPRVWDTDDVLGEQLMNAEFSDRLRYLKYRPIANLSENLVSDLSVTSITPVEVNHDLLTLVVPTPATETVFWLNLHINYVDIDNAGASLYFDIQYDLDNAQSWRYVSTNTTSAASGGIWQTRQSASDEQVVQVSGFETVHATPVDYVSFRPVVWVSANTGTVYSAEPIRFWGFAIE